MAIHDLEEQAWKCGSAPDREPEQPYPPTRPKPGEGLRDNPMEDPATWAGGGKVNGERIRQNDRR